MTPAGRSPIFLCAAAAVSMAVALQLGAGMFHPAGLVLATLASALAVWAALQGDRPGPALPAEVALGVGFLHGLYCHLFEIPTFYANPQRLQGFRGLALMALVFGSAYLCLHLRGSLQRARFLAVLACFAAMGVVIVHLSRGPRIDVWLFQQIGGEALWRGYSPYSVSYPDLYAVTGETLKMYGPEVVHDHRIFMYPYPPLTALLAAPAWAALGDVRYVSLAALVTAGWAIGRLGGGFTGEIAALFLLFQGRSFFVLEQAWSETLVLAAFAVTALLIARPTARVPQWLSVGLAAGVLAASKQYSPLLLLPLALAIPRPQRLRAALVALAVLLATALPFLLQDPRGLWRGVVQMQFLQPLRQDSLSLLALYARSFGAPWWGALPAFIAAAAVLALTVRRTLTLASAATSAAAAWLVFVLLNKQAFCNYDFLGVGLLCVAIAAHARTDGPRTAPNPAALEIA